MAEWQHAREYLEQYTRKRKIEEMSAIPGARMVVVDDGDPCSWAHANAGRMVRAMSPEQEEANRMILEDGDRRKQEHAERCQAEHQAKMACLNQPEPAERRIGRANVGY